MSIKKGKKKINHALANTNFEGNSAEKNFQNLFTRFRDYTKGVFHADFYIVLIIILVGLSGFGLGRLSALEEGRLEARIEDGSNLSANVQSAVEEGLDSSDTEGKASKQGTLVASRNGSKYHFPWCSGAQRIKEENEIWFDSAEDARRAGYSPAANCKGLK